MCESGSSPSGSVDRVVTQGFVDRRPGPTDARIVELSLTAEGERVAQEVATIEDRTHAAIDAISAPTDRSQWASCVPS
jgi:DNA-binding MarR family transcriptional regulator